MYTFQAARPLDKFQSHLGMGCVECEGTCGGMGDLFSTWDPREWSWVEWLAAVGVAYVASSVLFTSHRAARGIRDYRDETRRKRAAYYRKRAAELSR